MQALGTPLFSCDLFCEDFVFAIWDLVDLGCAEVEVGLRHLGWQAAYPLVEGDVGEVAGAEHLEEDDVFCAGVFDVVAGDGGDVAYVVGVEVHGAGLAGGGEDSHASFAADPVLPLGGVGVPVELAHAAGLDSNQRSGDGFGGGEDGGVDYADIASGIFYRGLHGLHAEGVVDLRLDSFAAYGALIVFEGAGELAREDVELVVGK